MPGLYGLKLYILRRYRIKVNTLALHAGYEGSRKEIPKSTTLYIIKCSNITIAQRLEHANIKI
jgi:hypothetical protein